MVDAEDLAAGAVIALIIVGLVGGSIAITHFVTTSDYGVCAQAGIKAERASDAAAKSAGDYERASQAALMYEMAGDRWMAAVAHGMAAEAAGSAAGEWTGVVEWIDGEIERSGASIPQSRQIAAAAAAGWLSVEASAYERAAAAAADAGQWMEAAAWSDNAARALAMSEALSIDARTAKERQRVADAIDRLAWG